MIGPKGQLHSLELWNKTLAVNLTGTFNLTRLVLEHLTRVKPEEGADGERGVIIMISSEVAVRIYGINCDHVFINFVFKA